MRLESLSSIAEITPYYGTLDEVFRLMNTLWMKTRKIWTESKVQLQKDIYRKEINWGIYNDIRSDFLLKNQLTLMLFDDMKLQAQNEAEYKTLINLIDEVKEPEMISAFDLYLSPTRDFAITLDTYREYQNDNDLSLIDFYIQTIKKMKEKRMGYSNVWSYVFVEELPLFYEWDFIKIIIFAWSDSSNSKDFIKIWNQFRKSSQWKIEQIYLLWWGMSKFEFCNLANSIDNDYIKIISSYSINNNILNDTINLNLKLNKKFLIEIRKNEWFLIFKYSSNYLLL